MFEYYTSLGRLSTCVVAKQCKWKLFSIFVKQYIWNIDVDLGSCSANLSDNIRCNHDSTIAIVFLDIAATY